MASCIECPAEPKIKGIWCSEECRNKTQKSLFKGGFIE